MNRVLRRAGRFVGYGMSTLVSLFLLVGPPYVSWYAADRILHPGERLRSFFRVERELPASSHIQQIDLQHDVGHINGAEDVLYVTSIVGRYLRANLTRNTVVTKDLVLQRPEIAAASKSVVVQVRVDRVYAPAIVPGTHLAFARQKGSSVENGKEAESAFEKVGVPLCGSGEAGLSVVSVLAPEGDAGKALIGVLLDIGKLNLASQLAVHEWTPIVLGDGACEQ